MKGLFVVVQKWAVVLALTLAAGSLLLSAPPAKAKHIFTVNLTTDINDRNLSDDRCDVSATPGSQCTLRAAMREANSTPGADTIHFDIPGGGVKTIRPTAELPIIMQPVTINGYTQHGSRPNSAAVGTNAVLHIQLDGRSNAESSDGLHIHAPHTVIRGLAIGHFREGIEVHRAFNQIGAHDVRITGCFIGTSASGTQARPNQTGIEVHTSRVSIGGERIGSRNLISGNIGAGVQLLDPAETGARVLGNWIGTDSTGTAPLGNGGSGIRTEQSDVHIGGDEIANIANTIRFNGGDGVSVVSGSSTRILTNSISDNGGLGIDLNDDSTTPNDAGDTDDTLANHGQNFPVITSSTKNSATGTTTITGQLNSNPNQTYTIQCFLTEAGGDPSGHGEGKTMLSTTMTATDENGDSPTFSCISDVPAVGDRMSMTATNATVGDTSEFSQDVVVTSST
jgi:hypothetical protein